MKKFRFLLAVGLILGILTACGGTENAGQDRENTILATTYPMYYLTQRLTEGIEDVTVELMVSEAVSCLHDYTLTTEQMKKIERMDLIVMNGGGLEDLMASALEGVQEEKCIVAGAEFTDPHYWLSPEMYQEACRNVCEALKNRDSSMEKLLDDNLAGLLSELDALQQELQAELSDLSCRELITFHDGFSCFAEAFDLKVVASIEEEEGAEASAKEIQEICDLIGAHQIPAIFVEKNGATNAAGIIARETGVGMYTLNTMMDGQTDYMTAMRENVQAVREALS